MSSWYQALEAMPQEKAHEEPRSGRRVIREIRERDLNELEALVVGVNRDGSYSAWSRLRPRGLIKIAACFCPTRSLMGRWVSVWIDEENVVRESVKILEDVRCEDVLETHLFDDRVEVFAILAGTAANTLHNSYFGTVRDDRKVIQDFRIGGSYLCSIEHVWIDGRSPQWTTMSDQVVFDRNEINQQLRAGNVSPLHHHLPSAPSSFADSRTFPVESYMVGSHHNKKNAQSSSKDLTPPPPAATKQRKEITEDQRRIMELELKMQRMGEIVFFMTKNEKIKKQIKCEDYDQYEELMELAEESLTF